MRMCSVSQCVSSYHALKLLERVPRVLEVQGSLRADFLGSSKHFLNQCEKKLWLLQIGIGIGSLALHLLLPLLLRQIYFTMLR